MGKLKNQVVTQDPAAASARGLLLLFHMHQFSFVTWIYPDSEPSPEAAKYLSAHKLSASPCQP